MADSQDPYSEPFPFPDHYVRNQRGLMIDFAFDGAFMAKITVDDKGQYHWQGLPWGVVMIGRKLLELEPDLLERFPWRLEEATGWHTDLALGYHRVSDPRN